MTMKKILEPMVIKIVERASETGVLTKDEFTILIVYQKECNKKSSNPIDDLIKNGTKIIGAIDSVMGGLI